jgi:hypothetical protein
MSLMYRRRPARGPIEQGDILRDVPQLTGPINLAKLITAIDGQVHLQTKRADEPLLADQVVAVTVVPVDALVLTQSCDVLRSPFVLLAPIVGLPVHSNQAKRAEEVRRVATSLRAIGSFYLPDLPALGRPRRIAQLDQVFCLPAAELRDYVTQHNLVECGLTGKALEYLQYRIGVVFGRLARDDGEWPSVDDLSDWRVSIELEIQKVEKRHGECADDVLKVELIDKLTGLRDELNAYEGRQRLLLDHLASEFPTNQNT